MPYNSYNKHYTDYRHLRLSAEPKRNFHNVAYETITGTNISFDFENVGEKRESRNQVSYIAKTIDQEQAQFYWEVAKTKALIVFLNNEKRKYEKQINYPIAIRGMGLTEYYEIISTKSDSNYSYSPDRRYQKRSWLERYEAAINSWNLWKDEKIGRLRDYHGCKDAWEVGRKKYKDNALKEYEYMTSGEGFNYYLNYLTIESNLDTHEQVFGESKNYKILISQKKKEIRQAREKLARIINKELSKNIKEPQWGDKFSSYYVGDATKTITSLRNTNKEIKDLEQDFVHFKTTFASEFEESKVIGSFSNSIDEISEDNPYYSKRVLWESLLDTKRKTYDEICQKIQSLDDYLVSLGTEEEFEAKREEKDKLFRQRYERKLELQKIIEDRKQEKIDIKEKDDAEEQIARIKKTRKGHGHMSSDNVEKVLYLSSDEAYDDLVKLYTKDNRKLKPYPHTISVKYSQWCKESRHRRWEQIELDAWFLKRLKE